MYKQKEEVNAVNILVQTAEGKFIIFEQEKYAIPGKTLSPVGGFIDVGESPLTAAKREVLEELGLGSEVTLEKAMELASSNVGINAKVEGSTVDQMKKLIQQSAHPDEVENFPTSNPLHEIQLSTGNIPPMENDPDWIFLGRYRTAANRGGGFIYEYLLKNAIPLVPNGGTAQYLSEGDDESQSLLYLTQDQLMEMVMNGRFQEVKWTAGIALALLHLNSGVSCCSGKQSAGLCFGDTCT
jgi:8-oxo-dGTP pyrophosphatase MutT (NUDIX family)